MKYLLVRESFDDVSGKGREVHLGIFSRMDELAGAKADDMLYCLRHDFGYVPSGNEDAADVLDAFTGASDYYRGNGFAVFENEVDGDSMSSPKHLWRMDELR